MNITKKWFSGAPVNGARATVATEFEVTNAELVFSGKLDGALSNDIEVKLVDPSANNKPLTISVTSTVITINLATGGTGAITTKASEVKKIIKGNELANKLVFVDYATGNTGAGVVKADELKLTGGIAGTICADKNVIVQEGQQLYINIEPNGIHDANWRKLNIVALT